MTDSLLPPATPAASATAHAAPPSALATAATALQSLHVLLQAPAPSAQATGATQAAAQAANPLQACLAALQGLPHTALLRLLQAMENALRQPPAGHSAAESPAPHDVLLLACRDALAHVHTLQAGRTPAADTLFAAYRAVCKLGGKDTAHPADLWEHPWQLHPVPAPLPAALQVPALPVAPSTRAQLDQRVLAVVKTADAGAAAQLRDLCLGLAHSRSALADTAFWHAAAGCFDATAHGLLEQDLYTKRLASRVLMHYASLAKSSEGAAAEPPATLVRDLLYYCAQAADTAQMVMDSLPPVLLAVCRSCQLLPAATLARSAACVPGSLTLDLGHGAEQLPLPDSPTTVVLPHAAPAPLDREALGLSHLVFGDTPDQPDQSDESDQSDSPAALFTPHSIASQAYPEPLEAEFHSNSVAPPNASNAPTADRVVPGNAADHAPPRTTAATLTEGAAADTALHAAALDSLPAMAPPGPADTDTDAAISHAPTLELAAPQHADAIDSAADPALIESLSAGFDTETPAPPAHASATADTAPDTPPFAAVADGVPAETPALCVPCAEISTPRQDTPSAEAEAVHAAPADTAPVLEATQAHTDSVEALFQAEFPHTTSASLPPDSTPPVLELQPGAALLQGHATAQPLEPNQAFLNEADALSQRLQGDLAAWADAPDDVDTAPLPTHAAELARTLSRSAWGAGCTEISLLTHTLQMVLDRIATSATPAQRQACAQAGDEVLRLLHQFAAGFMRRPQPQILEALNHILAQTTAAPPAPQTAADRSEGSEDRDSANDEHTTFIDGTQALPTEDTAPRPACAEPAAPAAMPPVATTAVDQLEPVRFAVFEEEVLTIWPALQTALHQWMEQPTEQGTPRQTLLRSLHTLKGSARLAGAAAWASQVHALEDLALLAQPHDGPLGPSALQQPLEVLRLDFVALQQEMATRHPERSLQHWGSSPIETVGRHAQALWTTHDHTAQALADNRLTLAEMDSCLQRLRSQLKDCAAWADTLVLHGDMDLSYEWHEELHDLIRNLGDCTDDIGTVQHQVQHGLATAETALSTQAGHLRALQHTLLYARLTPLAQLHDRLQATVQLAASDTGKTIALQMDGGEQLLERSVAEPLAPALEHLLRNCVDHGIESAAQRQAAGKPSEGQIRIRLHTQGTTQTLTVQDDGAGLPLERIRSKAVALGLQADSDAVDATRAAELILHPGLSTAAHITELSGRGIGMDAVQASVQALGGQLQIHSQPGQGCTFTITLPAPPQVEQVVALRAGSWSLALPARSIEAVRRIPVAQMDQAVAQGMLPDDVTGPMPLYWAGAVWQQSARSSAPPVDGQAIALVVRSDTSRWALQVDEVVGTQEVALQPATDVAVPLPGLLGTAAQPSGQVLQVYDPYAALAAHEARRLLQAAQPTAPAGDAAEASAPEAQRPLILLADDSLSVRRLAQHLLQSQGYRVATAADGLQALKLLESGELPAQPALLLADIEMPEMDGLELLRRVRANPASKQLPVVMLTAHEAGPVSQKAIDAGAQAFLTKPYAPNELLALVRRCARVEELTS